MNKYNDTYHSTIKVKLVDVKLNTYINSSEEINDKDPQFNIGDIFAISKYKNNNWSTESFVIKNVKNTVSWTCVILDLNREEIDGTFYKKELQKTNEKEFRFEKLIKREGDKLYVKWKDFNNSFNSWKDFVKQSFNSFC